MTQRDAFGILLCSLLQRSMNLHLKVIDGGNNHHMAEALLKAFEKLIDEVVMKETA